MAKWANAKNSLVANRCNAAVDSRYKRIAGKAKELKTESVDDFLKRGGTIKKLPPK